MTLYDSLVKQIEHLSAQLKEYKDLCRQLTEHNEKATRCAHGWHDRAKYLEEQLRQRSH